VSTRDSAEVRSLERHRQAFRARRVAAPARVARRGVAGAVAGVPRLSAESSVAGHLQGGERGRDGHGRTSHAARLPKAMKVLVRGRKESVHASRRWATLTVGDAVRIAREFAALTQKELAQLSGIPQPAISGIEQNRVTLGADRAAKLGRALKVHPGMLVFPNWSAGQL
jgi:DNA-binding XRE family transcriptional regulator